MVGEVEPPVLGLLLSLAAGSGEGRFHDKLEVDATAGDDMVWRWRTAAEKAADDIDNTAGL